MSRLYLSSNALLRHLPVRGGTPSVPHSRPCWQTSQGAHPADPPLCQATSSCRGLQPAGLHPLLPHSTLSVPSTGPTLSVLAWGPGREPPRAAGPARSHSQPVAQTEPLSPGQGAQQVGAGRETTGFPRPGDSVRRRPGGCTTTSVNEQADPGLPFVLSQEEAGPAGVPAALPGEGLGRGGALSLPAA